MLVAGAVAVAPVAAGADPVALAGASVNAPFDGNMTYTGKFGFANSVVVTAFDDDTVVVDDVHPLSIAGECSFPNPADLTRAECHAMFDLTIEPGAGDDSVTIAGDTQNWRLDLGDGTDTADVTGANPQYANPVQLIGGDGDDDLDGAGGNDLLVGGAGADEQHGGTGTDTVSYAGHSQAVVADLDGVADDGAPGENDLIAVDVENLSGGLHADTLTGSGGANRLVGDACLGVNVFCVGTGDVLIGAGGADELLGGHGDDTLDGGLGNDDLDGGSGNDDLDGGAGFDSLDGGPGTDGCDTGLGGGSTTACE